MVVSSDGSTLYVTDSIDKLIRAVDVASKTVTTLLGKQGTQTGYTKVTFEIEAAFTTALRGLALSPDGTTLYAGGGNRIFTIDLTNNTVKELVSVGTGIYGLALSSDGTTIYAADKAKHVVYKIDVTTASVTVLAGKDGEPHPTTYNKLRDPSALLLSPDGSTLYVTQQYGNAKIRTVVTGQLICGDGQKKNAAEDACEACPNNSVSSGFAPTCTPCTVDGESPNAAQTACEPCPAGFAGTGGSCQACENGEQPNAGKTACDACPAGFAGTGGSCQQCADGKQPDASKTACEACPNGSGGTDGICEACLSGKTEQNNVCTDCGSNAWSSGGESACTNCTDGEEPNGDRSGCAACGEGTAGTGGSCDACPEGHGPSADMTKCVVILPDSAGYRPHAKATLLLSLLAGASCVARF
jgi:WD40 repeat protein